LRTWLASTTILGWFLVEHGVAINWGLALAFGFAG
jgi:hypothetical protein